jgi:hypothetical protein
LVSSDARRFLLSVEGAPPLGCREVRGFHEAALASRAPRAAPPARLVLVGLDEAGLSWVAVWAEDCELVRRSITIRRLLDDVEVTAVATLASYGYGVDTALAVESIASAPASECGVPSLLRSGVHPKATIDALLGPAVRAPWDQDDGAEDLFA